MLTQDSFSQLVNSVFQQSPAGAGDIAEIIYFTNDGVISVSGEEIGSAGVGIAQQITATHEVLEVVSNLNQSMNFGHYWISPGANLENWSLICGFKFLYSLAPAEYVWETVTGLVNHHEVVAEAVRGHLAEIPHAKFWSTGESSEPSAAAMILASHLH